MIYISSGCLKYQDPIICAKSLLRKYKNIEFSGGSYSSLLLNKIIKLNSIGNFQFHNYFPPPKKDFVMNLASLNPISYQRTLRQIYKAIDWSHKIGSQFYSIHAGFLIDLDANEIGKSIKKKKLFSREKSINKFIKRLNLVSNYAKDRNITILVENNVTSSDNFKNYKCNPFLMSTPDECHYIMSQTDSNVQLLIDVGHLKVSANTLGFKSSDMFKKCKKWIFAYHLSENDGKSDLNQSFDTNSWFWKYLDKNVKFATIEVYNIDNKKLNSLYKISCRKLLMN